MSPSKRTWADRSTLSAPLTCRMPPTSPCSRSVSRYSRALRAGCACVEHSGANIEPLLVGEGLSTEHEADVAAREPQAVKKLVRRPLFGDFESRVVELFQYREGHFRDPCLDREGLDRPKQWCGHPDHLRRPRRGRVVGIAQPPEIEV